MPDMNPLKLLILVLGLLSTYSYAVLCPEMEDKVTSLPDFDSKYKFPCMYSGFVEVDNETDSNLFYWFYRDEDLSTKSPLVLWVNGGPGASSQLGNLVENGPLKLVKDKNGKIKVNSLEKQAWTAVANVLFLDQPVGVGYSYGDLNITDIEQVKEHAIKFIQGFYVKHPEMKDRDFFITGESYGGRYEPAFASAIIDYNLNAADKDKIPLKGVLIGNGFVDTLTQRLAIRHPSLALGSIQFDSIPELDTLERRCQDANSKKASNAAEVWVDIAKFVTTVDGGIDMYDARYPETNVTEQEADLVKYLNMEYVVKSLHWESSTKEIKYSSQNDTVYANFMPDALNVYIEDHKKILDNNITLLLFVGQFDKKDGPYGVQEWMKKLDWEGIDEFHASSRNVYYYASDDGGEVRLGGNFKHHKNLHLMMIYAAGHLVPTTQLALSRSMLSDIIYNDKLLCHLSDGTCSIDQKTWEMMDNCNGNGNCVNGKCVWNSGYYGGDWSVTTEALDIDDPVLNATSWKFYKLDANEGTLEVKIKPSGGPLHIYTYKKGIPSRSFFTWYMEVEADEEIKFYLSKKNSGEYVALFNPDYDKQITVDMDAVHNSRIMGPLLWVVIVCFVAAVIILFFTILYCYKSRLAKQRYKLLNDSKEDAGVSLN